jgi:transposase
MAAALGVSEGAASQWMARARDVGPEALRRRPPPGAPRRLSPDQLARLPELWHRGPPAYGFRGELWTRSRVAAMIRLACGTSSHPRHVGRRLAVIRWSPQKPVRRARQRDEAAIARWRDDTRPAINKGRKSSSTRSFS